MDIERAAIDGVRVDVGNVRKHSKRNLDTIKRSLEVFGQQKPIVVTADGLVVAGNGTLDAARALGWSHIDVVRTALKGSARKAYAVADNRTAELAEWDETGLAEYLAGLKADTSFDETVTGFDPGEIERLIGSPEIMEDETPPVPETPVTRRGDLWLLGDHQVLCGDATKAEDVKFLMGDVLAQLVFTDPPYGVDIQERDMAQAEIRGRRKDGKGIRNDDLTSEQLSSLLIATFKLALTYTELGACWYVCSPSGVDYRHPLNILADLGVARHGLVWVKDRFVMGRCDYHYRHENIIYGWSPGEAHKAVPTRDQNSVWEFVRPSRSPQHPTIKPVGLVAKAIANSSDIASVIFDPFLGSGTTLIAAEQLGRRCFGIEIEPTYVDVTLKRWANLTGKSPVRESDGAAYADLALDNS